MTHRTDKIKRLLTMIAASDTEPGAMNFVVEQLEAMMPEEKPFTKGTLVKALPGAVEGDPEKLGLGIVTTEPKECEWGEFDRVDVRWLRSGKVWSLYTESLVIVEGSESD